MGKAKKGAAYGGLTVLAMSVIGAGIYAGYRYHDSIDQHIFGNEPVVEVAYEPEVRSLGPLTITRDDRTCDISMQLIPRDQNEVQLMYVSLDSPGELEYVWFNQYDTIHKRTFSLSERKSPLMVRFYDQHAQEPIRSTVLEIPTHCTKKTHI